jgi:hypothetical protein
MFLVNDSSPTHAIRIRQFLAVVHFDVMPRIISGLYALFTAFV